MDHDHHDHHHPDPHDHDAAGSGLTRMAASATLHCLTGCAIGEILGLMIGTAIGLTVGWTIALAVALAFLFGYALSTLPLIKSGLGFAAALGLVFAADTLSIATMELVDNLVMALIPGAMDAGLVDPIFWIGMLIALTAAFLAAFPVNRYLLARGKGHALTHAHHAAGDVRGARRFIPDLGAGTLAAVIISFLVGGLVVAVASDLEGEDAERAHQPARSEQHR